MTEFHEAIFILCPCDRAAETIDSKLQQSATSGGTYTDITGKAATQFAAHASNYDNVQVVINLKAEELSDGMKYSRPGPSPASSPWACARASPQPATTIWRALSRS